jgi:hypothetical protein
MRLEDQVCNLELSKRLKELDVRQASIFYWEDRPEGPRLFPSSSDEVHMYSTYAAFTVAELGELIRPYFKLPEARRTARGVFWGIHKSWLHGYSVHEDNEIEAKTEADARAKMLIYLIEKGLVSARMGA